MKAAIIESGIAAPAPPSAAPLPGADARSRAPLAAPRARRFTLLLRAAADAAELVKARVLVLILLATAAGFVLGARAAGVAPDLAPLLLSLLGTALVAGGAAAWNQVLERGRDALMERTRGRPVPAGRVSPRRALGAGGALAAAGATALFLVEPLAAGLALITFAAYVFIYTPLKARSHLSTLVGAVPGALPPLIGWAAAAGKLDPAAWTLFGILFFWQLPHFLAIAWLYRRDYARGGFPLLTVVDPSGAAACRQALLQGFALLLASLLPAVAGQAGAAYLWVALSLGIVFLGLVSWLAAARSELAARAVVAGSVIYLASLLLALLLDGPLPRP